MGPNRGIHRSCAVPVTILINRTCEVNEPPALQKTFAATGAPRRTRLGSYSGWIAFRPRHEESTRNRLLRAIELGLQRIRHREFGNSQNQRPASIAIAQKFPWQKYKTFADVGTAEGCLPVQVALANPHLVGEGFDLPMVRPFFEEYVVSFGLQGRLRFHPGNFFKDSLPSADVLVMGMILHDWNLEEKRTLLNKAYDALPNSGALIVYEHLIDDERRKNIAGLLISLTMLIETQGGFDYTGADCCGWMRDAGFREKYVEQLTGIESMVVGIK